MPITEATARAAMATHQDGDFSAYAPPELPIGELDPDELRHSMVSLDHEQMEKLVLSLAADVVLWRDRFYRLQRYK